MKLFVAVGLGSLRRDYLIDSDRNHVRIAVDMICKEKPELTKEEKANGLRYEPRHYGSWPGEIKGEMKR